MEKHTYNPPLRNGGYQKLTGKFQATGTTCVKTNQEQWAGPEEQRSLSSALHIYTHMHMCANTLMHTYTQA